MSTTVAAFEWDDTSPANGDSGVGLAQAFLKVVANLQGVKRICDLGCGNGYLAGQLASLGYEVTGVDASASGIEIARRTYPNLNFILSPLDNLHNELAPFDLIVSSDVIEHLYSPAELLETASALLSPNGQIVIGTPYHGYLKNLALSISGKMEAHFCSLDDGGHIKFFSVRTLSSLVQSQGFTDLKFTFYGRAPWLWKNMICYARKISSELSA